jgi:cytochrome c-type biogenesis protein CcmH
LIWALFILLSVSAAVLMGMPLLRQARSGNVENDSTSAVLLDQLAEVKRDTERGIISESEAQAAEQEIKRRILLESRKEHRVSNTKAGGGRVTLLISAIFVPLMAVGYYAYMGSPKISSIAFAERAEERRETARVTEMTDELYRRLTTDPQGGPSEGWMLLGQTYSRMGRYEDAVQAFEVVAGRAEANSVVFSMLAEALIFADQGVVTPRAEAAVDRSMALDATNPAAVFYKSIALSQNGQAAQAYDMLVAQLNDADDFYPWMESFVAEANRIGAGIGKAPLSLAHFAPMINAPGPTNEDVANAQDMSDEEREAFIRSMVDRLANRLQDKPQDLEGWMRLGNAYAVLGENALAVEAFERADALLANEPEDDPRRQAVSGALTDLRN